jgi:hypothetical protein
MTERQIVNWLLGFVIGILTVLAWQRVMSEPYITQDTETTRAEELISIYKRGMKDALRTSPVSFELEQTCLEVWANKHKTDMSSANQKQFGGDHYKRMGIEPWDVVDTWPLEQRIGYYRGGALKYIMRMGSKDQDPQEIEKGKHYMEKLLEVLNER